MLNLCWYCWMGGFPHSYYYVVVFHLKINDVQPQGAGNTVIQNVIWSVTTPIVRCHPYQSVQSSKFVSTKEETFLLFFCLQVIFWSTNNHCIRHINSIVGFLRVVWGWKLFCTREHKDSWDEFLTEVYSTRKHKYCKFLMAGLYKTSVKTEILQNSEEVEFINHKNKQKYCKILKRWNL